MRYSEQTVTRIMVYLLCDVCGSYGPAGDDKMKALKAAKEWGWRVDLPHDRAYCPEHVGVLLENRRKEKEMPTKWWEVFVPVCGFCYHKPAALHRIIDGVHQYACADCAHRADLATINQQSREKEKGNAN